MDQKQLKPRTMSLHQVLDAANRASEQMSAWPAWKQELSTPHGSARTQSLSPSDRTNTVVDPQRDGR